MSTNYYDTFIAASPDGKAAQGTVPVKSDSIAGLQYGLLAQQPYSLTSDELLFTVHARRNQIPDADLDAARTAFFAKSQACLRASPLVKQFGWGIHHDEAGRIALYGVETETYRDFTERPDIKVLRGMRSRRA